MRDSFRAISRRDVLGAMGSICSSMVLLNTRGLLNEGRAADAELRRSSQ